MPLELSDCQFTGPALPEPFVKFELENELTKLKLLAKTTGIEGKELKADWEAYRRHLAQLAVRGGPVRVRNQAIEPLCQRLGYTGDIVSGGDADTGVTVTARGRRRTVLAIQALGENPGRRRLADSASAGEQVRVSHAIGRDRVAQRLGHLVLPHQFAERLRPIPPRDDDVLVRRWIAGCGGFRGARAIIGLAGHETRHHGPQKTKTRPPKSAPRTRVHRLWLLLLRPDQVHGSPLRGTHFDGRRYPQNRTPPLYAQTSPASKGMRRKAVRQQDGDHAHLRDLLDPVLHPGDPGQQVGSRHPAVHLCEFLTNKESP